MFTIGELARRTELSVRTIRFYSDTGLVPPSGRTTAGYRMYDADALARLEAVRTLRDLGLDLETVTHILDREASLGDVVALHARHAGAAGGHRRPLRHGQRRPRRALLAAARGRQRLGALPQHGPALHVDHRGPAGPPR